MEEIKEGSQPTEVNNQSPLKETAEGFTAETATPFGQTDSGFSMEDVKKEPPKEYIQNTFDRVINESMPHIREHIIEMFNSPWSFITNAAKVFIFIEKDKKQKVIKAAAKLNVIILLGNLIRPLGILSWFSCLLSLTLLGVLWILVDSVTWLDSLIGDATNIAVAERRLNLRRNIQEPTTTPDKNPPPSKPVDTASSSQVPFDMDMLNSAINELRGPIAERINSPNHGLDINLSEPDVDITDLEELGKLPMFDDDDFI